VWAVPGRNFALPRLSVVPAWELTLLTKYVIGPDVALHLAEREAVIRDQHQLLAPTLFRSQTQSLLYRAVRQGDIDKKDADRRLSYVRSLRIRLLGDRVLQQIAGRSLTSWGGPTLSTPSTSHSRKSRPTL
jgi:hypothetical protein